MFFPVLMEERFESYIKEVIEYVADSIADENEVTRMKVIRILKICIMKFGMTNTEVLLVPIREVQYFLNYLTIGIATPLI